MSSDLVQPPAAPRPAIQMHGTKDALTEEDGKQACVSADEIDTQNSKQVQSLGLGHTVSDHSIGPYVHQVAIDRQK